MYELDEAVKVALRLLNMEETLIIVTADHSHSFTLNGYPERGNDILGITNKSGKLPYETLSYANGPGFYYHRRNDSNNVNETWRKVEDDQTRNEPFYRYFAGKYLKDESHGGEDVGVYAFGKKYTFLNKFLLTVIFRLVERKIERKRDSLYYKLHFRSHKIKYNISSLFINIYLSCHSHIYTISLFSFFLHSDTQLIRLK